MQFIKSIVSAILILTINQAIASDSLSVKAKPRIGPPELLLPPPIDSIQLIKISITDRLTKSSVEQTELRNRQNSLSLQNLLLQTETAVSPDASIIGTLEDVLSEYIRMNDLNGQALVYSTYGVYYGRFGQADKAIYYFNEAFKLKETLKDNEGAAKIAENLSALYRINGQFDLAVKFAEFRIAEHLRQSKTAAAANMHLIIAQLKLAQKKFKQSEYNVLNKAFPLFKRTGSKFGRMRCFQTLAEIYFEQGRYSEAKWFYIQAQIMSAKIFDNQAMISSLIGLGKTKHAQGDYLEALQDYKQAEELALRNNYLVNLVEINAGLGETYNKRGDYQAADAALNEYHKFRESWIKANKL